MMLKMYHGTKNRMEDAGANRTVTTTLMRALKNFEPHSIALNGAPGGGHIAFGKIAQ